MSVRTHQNTELPKGPKLEVGAKMSGILSEH